MAIGQTRAVPDLDLELPWLWFTGDPVYLANNEPTPGMVEVVVGMGHVNAVGRHVFLHNIPRATRQADSLTLADGVEPESAMFGQRPAGLQLDNLAGPLAQVKSNKLRILDLA